MREIEDVRETVGFNSNSNNHAVNVNRNSRTKVAIFFANRVTIFGDTCKLLAPL